MQTPLNTEEAARPSDAQNVAALKSTADALTKLTAKASGPGAEAANRLAANLTKLADAGKDKRDAVEAAFTVSLRTALTQLRNYLQAGPVTQQKLPPSLVSQWIAADGRVRVQATPKGDPNDNENAAPLRARHPGAIPEAVGTPVSILESARPLSGLSSTPASLRSFRSRSCCGSCCGASAMSC